jgi:hypothetical protein
LPEIYFSSTWGWYPEAGEELRPRREVWGGLWLALLGLTFWAWRWRRDPLAWRLALWGMLGGALGFSLGQGLQAGHAWHPEFFDEGWLAPLSAHLNWWNLMETTFGFVWGGFVALGLWFNRNRIRLPDAMGDPPEALRGSGKGDAPRAWEWGWLVVHLVLLLLGEFGSWGVSDVYIDYSLVLATIPILAVAAGRWWPWWLLLPVTLLPIAGKTLKRLAFDESVMSPATGSFLYAVIPLMLAIAAAVWAGRQARERAAAGRVFSPLLLLAIWLYFGLNFAFFRYPWPWEEWTRRTPHALVFLLCTFGLTAAAIRVWRTPSRTAN